MGNLNNSRLGGAGATFQDMIQRFGVVTVMNADVYDTSKLDVESWKGKQADTILNEIEANRNNDQIHLCRLDTLKIANMTQEGPTKTVTGGQYSNPLIKFGKSARCEMQDALGNARALDALCGTVSEMASANNNLNYNQVYALHVTEDFSGPRTIVGDSFFIEQTTGKQVKVKIIIYQFLPDSIFNLTQDAEGDATVFDMNGDLLTTEIKVSKIDGSKEAHGVFYSIVDPTDSTGAAYTIDPTDGKITLASGFTATLDNQAVESGTTTVAAGTAGRLVVKNSNNQVVIDTIVVGPNA